MAIIFPRPFAFAVDDLGWNEGSDLSNQSPKGPHRTGVKRNFNIHDYEAMVAVAKAAGVRVQCLFILSEMDRANVLAQFPTTTYLREQWDNTLRVNEHQREIMKYVVASAAFMEFGLHGTGHEYWAPGEDQKRAEWYNLRDKQPWPEQSLREHIECFRQIMAQYDLTPAHGHSFPESFVPCAYSYYWNPTGDYSLGKLLTEAGVKYANTDFGQIPELNPPAGINGGGFDFGTHVVNRLNYGNPWYKLDCLPPTPLEQQETDMIESHWPNWLAQDDFLQKEVTEKWIAYYRAVQESADRYVAKNTEQFHAQWLYKKYTVVTESEGVVQIDNSAMPADVFKIHPPENLALKIRLAQGQHVSRATLDGTSIASYFEDGGYGFIYLPALEVKKYELRYSLGSAMISKTVYNDGTYNVYQVSDSSDRLSIKIRSYGTQAVKVLCKSPKSVKSNAADLEVIDFHYDDGNAILIINLYAKDMQGSTGTVEVLF